MRSVTPPSVPAGEPGASIARTPAGDVPAGLVPVPVPEPGGPAVRTFAMHFTSTPRGARLARRLAVQRLDEWGHPYDSGTSQTAALLISELAANAVRHGHSEGEDFRLAVTLAPEALVRIEVTDSRPDRRPPCPGRVALCSPVPLPHPGRDLESESGRGLLLVDALATRWGVTAAGPGGKTVWAEYTRRPLETSRTGGTL